MNKKPVFPVTGQIIFRETSEQAPDNSGRKLMMLVGIIAVPESSLLKSEHQYTVVSETDKALIIVGGSKDVSEISHGQSLTGLITSPIWQI